MRPDGTPIQALLWRTLTPAIVIVAVALGALVYVRLYDTILDGFSRRLATVSALTGVLIDPVDHDALLAMARPDADAAAIEAGEGYRRNVEPMRRIRRELGLTYLYTQAIGGPRDVLYVLDATEGEEHSTIGSPDDLPDDTLAGLKATQTTGAIYASPIQYQEQWGLLKTAAAPVRGAEGRITATAGADVNISVIQVATQNAVLASAMIGLASLLASALVILAILRRVAQPIEGLKADALRIATGDRAPPVERRAPREVVRLRAALAGLADELVAAMRAARARTLAEDRARGVEAIRQALGAAEGGDGVEALLQARARAVLARRIAGRPELAADTEMLAGPR
ncbi:MAG: hypothetical protein JNL41_11860 [Phenylobacterium sp.]|uniref:hypothetical protein n=1 Tax=Phenylobacterium sp. TaxID=1871053 RepID=UPI001A448B77|nr:hypothetical protein [Phenylobacterium sp.]MBL8554966.1 hypothetical protein [Phenylobacterium sp.]